MTDDMGCDLELPDVGELTFPQWRDWLAQYNKFIGERDVRYAAGLRERDDRIAKLEAALREIVNKDTFGMDWAIRTARNALDAE